VLVLWGQSDVTLPFGTDVSAQRYRARLPQAQHVIVPDAGHTPFNEQPGHALPILCNFALEAAAVGRQAPSTSALEYRDAPK